VRAILNRILRDAAERGDGWSPSASVLASAWPGLVGEALAERTRPVEVDWETGRLTVEAPSEIWCEELARREDELLERLGAILPWQLDRLEFRVGSIEPAADATTLPAPDDSAEDDTTSNLGSDRLQGDSELEESIASLDEGAAASARRILGHVRAASDD